MTAAADTPAMIEIAGLNKTYDSGFVALRNIDLTIRKGEILALLGPNGAGKTTLISTICGITVPSGGRVLVGGHDIETQPGKTRRIIGLVPQEINIEPFQTVWNAVRFSRGLFGLPPDPARIEEILKTLSLWDKKDEVVKALSGGMKRRVLIAKALSHEPQVLFLDEPTAGVDVELRKDMWRIVDALRDEGVTMILTTHYIEEAEAIADRVAIISKGRILLVEDKDTLMQSMGKRSMSLELASPLETVPQSLEAYGLELSANGLEVTYAFDTRAERTGIASLLRDMSEAGLSVRDIKTAQSSLEEIFVELVERDTGDDESPEAPAMRAEEPA
ncbi:MAG: ABC transporter ATP-binding protein [Devosiaceae bacterium]|nr:ABC transporter ATP-binding protein [Devosiaceae bacterium MH13]